MKNRTIYRQMLKFTAVSAVAALAVGCGGSSSTDPDDPIIPAEVSNPLGLDVNGDTLLNDLDDVDGNGVVDNADEVLYAELNPELVNPENPTELLCDGDSENDSWTDNCVLNIGGAYANTSYTKGVQRILWCLGYGQGVADINTFADGQLGRMTETAIMEFQADVPVVADGIVGEQTWGALQSALTEPFDFDVDYNWHGVESAMALPAGGNCGDQIMFYQEKLTPFSWEMADTPGSTLKVPFSIGEP